MIKLFITDIDGCLSRPFETPDWDKMSELRRLNQQSRHDMAVPPLTICSGRPMPYVEAVTQWLGIDIPAVFESAGMYELSTNRVTFLPVFDDKAKEQVEKLKDWLQDEIIDRYPGMILEFTKRMDAGLVHLEKGIIDDVFPIVRDYVEKEYSRFEVHRTTVSINILVKGNNKKSGIERLCSEIGLDPEEAAYIGDSSGDIPGLEVVGRAFAPSNASDDVKKVSETLDEEVTDAVLAAYRLVIESNRKKIADKQES